MTTENKPTSTNGSESCKTIDRARLNGEAALRNACSGNSLMNYQNIFNGFKALGIPDVDIQPRVNIFTFAAWRQLGRVVSKGQHGVKVCTFIHAKAGQADDSKKTSFRMPRQTTVFHVSQTEPLTQPTH